MYLDAEKISVTKRLHFFPSFQHIRLLKSFGKSTSPKVKNRAVRSEFSLVQFLLSRKHEIQNLQMN